MDTLNENKLTEEKDDSLHSKENRALDEATRSLLSRKEILAYILCRYVDEFKDYTYEQVYTWLKALDGEKLKLKKSYKDFYEGFFYGILISLKTILDNLIFIDIETFRSYDVNKEKGLPLLDRAELHTAYMILRQYFLFENFTFDMLCKCYSIWFVIDCYKSQTENEINYVSDSEGEAKKDDLVFHKLIYLNPSNDSFLYTLLSTETGYEEKIEAFKKANVYYDNDTLKEVKAMRS